MALSRTLSPSVPLVQSFFSLSTIRHSSTKANPQLVEVDLDSTDSTEVIAVGIKKLEDAIHSIIVRRAAPDWLPFMPGYSYWVPPPSRSSSLRGRTQANSIIEVVGKLAEASSHASQDASPSARIHRKLLSHNYLASDDEQMAISSSRGWPSSDFFIQGTSPVHPISVVEVEMHIEDAEDHSNGSRNSKDVEE